MHFTPRFLLDAEPPVAAERPHDATVPLASRSGNATKAEWLGQLAHFGSVRRTESLESQVAPWLRSPARCDLVALALIGVNVVAILTTHLEIDEIRIVVGSPQRSAIADERPVEASV